MICPTYKAALLALGGIAANSVQNQCDHEECALWNHETQRCGLIVPKEIKVSGGVNTHAY